MMAGSALLSIVSLVFALGLPTTVLLAQPPGQALPEALREHSLSGEYAGFSECHLDADWLLVYRVTRDRVVFHRTGTHRQLFRARRRP